MLQTVLKYCVSSKYEVTQVFNSTWRAVSPILLEKSNIFKLFKSDQDFTKVDS